MKSSLSEQAGQVNSPAAFSEQEDMQL